MTNVEQHNPECSNSRDVFEIIRGLQEEQIVAEILRAGWSRVFYKHAKR